MPIFITLHLLELSHVAGKSTFEAGRSVAVNINTISHITPCATKQHADAAGTYINFVGEDDNNGSIRVAQSFDDILVTIHRLT